MASPLEMTEMYDSALFGILQNVGNVEDFLQIYFGFLYRKTDFYRLASSPRDRVGFRPGVAEKMVLNTFKLFERIAEQDRCRRPREETTRAVPPAAVEELETGCAQQQEAVERNAMDVQTETTGACGPLLPVSSGPNQPPHGEKATATSRVNSTEAGQEYFQSNPESYNGAVRDKYSWSQDYADVDVRVRVPKTVTKGSQVVVSLQSNSVRVCLRDGAQAKVMIEGELTHKINTEDSMWSLEPGRCVLLSLSKCGEIWWNALLKGEPEIDINKIQCERPLETIVDEEERATLAKLRFDNHQKMQGKPQSHEMKVHEMLKKGWDAEGSPYKGQPFDPSMLNIQDTKTMV